MQTPVTSLETILRNGCHLHVEGNYPPNLVCNLVSFAASKKAHITVNAKNFTPDALKTMAEIGKQYLTVIV